MPLGWPAFDDPCAFTFRACGVDNGDEEELSVMRRIVRSLTLASLPALSLLAMSSVPALGDATEELGVDCGARATAGGTVSCGVVGAAGDDQLLATAASRQVFYRETLGVDADGAAGFSFAVPSEVESSTLTVRVVGERSGATAGQVDVVDLVEDGAVPGAGAVTLPFSGTQVTVLTTVGLALLAFGLLALRRREDAKVGA